MPSTPDKNTPVNPELNFEQLPRRAKFIEQIAHYIVLLLSLALIVFISYDTFAGIPFLSNYSYMTFQLWVCIIFMVDFFLELYFAQDKKSYLANRWFFFIISIPYLNVVDLLHIHLDVEALYFIRYIPLVRGAYSLAMVVGFFSTNKAFTMLSQYAFILLSVIYFMSMIFFYEESPVNPQVLTYWDALYWAFLNVTTVGSDIEAVTIVGKVGTVLMAMSGMLMLPLFTVYVTDRVKRMNDRQRAEHEFLADQFHAAQQKRGDKGADSSPDAR